MVCISTKESLSIEDAADVTKRPEQCIVHTDGWSAAAASFLLYCFSLSFHCLLSDLPAPTAISVTVLFSLFRHPSSVDRNVQHVASAAVGLGIDGDCGNSPSLPPFSLFFCFPEGVSPPFYAQALGSPLHQPTETFRGQARTRKEGRGPFYQMKKGETGRKGEEEGPHTPNSPLPCSSLPPPFPLLPFSLTCAVRSPSRVRTVCLRAAPLGTPSPPFSPFPLVVQEVGPRCCALPFSRF